MNKLFFKLHVCCWLMSTYATAQSLDSLIHAQGNIINAESKEPIVARITYQSLPYGSRVGTFTASSFTFPMFDGEKYSIMVEADGFATAKYMLDPAEANEEGKIIRDIELTVGLSNAQKKHAVGHVMRLDNVIFQVGKSKVNPESFPELDLVVSMMKETANMVIQLEGHTDYLGDPKENMKLSKARVESVKNYLVSKGVTKNRIKTKAFGGTTPLSHDSTPEAHRLNRRVELRILEN